MNDENFTPTTDELTQDQWWLILWSFLTDIPEKEWNEFTHNLIYKDRFSSSHKVVDVIKRKMYSGNKERPSFLSGKDISSGSS